MLPNTYHLKSCTYIIGCKLVSNEVKRCSVIIDKTIRNCTKVYVTSCLYALAKEKKL